MIVINKRYKVECEKLLDEKFNEMIQPDDLKQDLIENSTTINNIYLKKFERCINSIQEDKKISEIKYFTVLVIGQSGVGKSCLIDNVLNLRIPEKGKAKRTVIDGPKKDK